jgi:hypothetical protein
VLEQNANFSCYGREMLRDERAFQSNIESWTRSLRPPCERSRRSERERVLAEHLWHLGSVARLSVEKFPVLFLLFTERPILLPAAVACTRPLSKPPGEESGRFWRNEPDGHPSRTQCRLGRNEPDQIWRRSARWQDELEPRQRADGNICDCRRGCATIIFAIFRKRSQSPQTKPTWKSQTNQCSKMNNTRL